MNTPGNAWVASFTTPPPDWTSWNNGSCQPLTVACQEPSERTPVPSSSATPSRTGLVKQKKGASSRQGKPGKTDTSSHSTESSKKNMPTHQPLLLPQPRQKPHRTLEGRTQHYPATLIPRTLNPKHLRRTTHPSKTIGNSQSYWT